MKKNKPPDRMFEFASFIASAARGSIEEGGMGASLRFLDALTKLPGIASEAHDDKFLREMSRFVKKRINIDFLVAREEYVRLLDDVLLRFAKEIRRRNGLGSE